METQDNLLITLGDSWTTGVGCGNKKDTENCGWAPIVQKKLKFSKLLNLAFDGASNSSTVKSFVDNILHLDAAKSFQSVTVIFLLTGFERFSFYSKGQISSFTLGGMHYTNYSHYESFLEWYVENIHEGDSERETIFYLDIVNIICKLHNYKFFWGTAFSNVKDLVNNLQYSRSYNHVKLDISNCIHYGEFNSFRDYLVSSSNTSPYNIVGEFEYGKDHELFAKCGHPNQAGYEMIADYIINKLQN